MIYPMGRDLLISQHHRVNRAVNAIYRSPGAALNLAALADIACMSKFHFSRVFSAHMGESPSSFLWRTRLERAARTISYKLANSITHTALDHGFSSPEAFSRAFSGHFGIAPRRYLRAVQSNRCWASSAASNSAVRRGGFRQTITPAPEDVSIQIQTIPSLRVAYLRRRGPYNVYACEQDGIGAGFGALFRLAEQQGFLHDDSCFIGVAQNSSHLTFADSCLYDICITLHDDIPENGLVSLQTIPGGTFAVLRVACPAPMIVEHWNWLRSVWLPASGAIPELAPSLERYPVRRDIADPRMVEAELCLRIKPR